MVMPNYYPAAALAPATAGHIASIGPNMLQGYYQGRTERLDDERRNYLREAGDLASSGNIAGAVGAAFRGGDPTTAMNISNWDTGRRKQALEMLIEGSRRADTPERWSAFANSVGRVFGEDMVRDYRDFNSRPGAMTTLEQALAEAQVRERQAHADLYGAQAGAAGRQVENQRAAIDVLRRPQSVPTDTVPPPLPVPPPVAAPSTQTPIPSLGAPQPVQTPIPRPQYQTPMPVAPPPPGGALPPAGPAPTAVQPAPQPQTAPAAPGAPTAPPAVAQPQQQRRIPIWQMFESASEADKAEIVALFNENKIAEGFKRLREISTGGAPLTAQQRSQSEEGLRREFATLAKPYFDVRDAYTRIEQVAQSPSPAGDLALIFNFMKMLDPGSTVREGEFATAQNSAGVPERIRALYERVMSGTRLTSDQRKDFVDQSGRLMSTQERQYQSIQSQYLDIAQRNGLDPRNVFVDFSRPPSGQAQQMQLIQEAERAIASGRDPKAVRERLRQMGIDPTMMGASTPGGFGAVPY